MLWDGELHSRCSENGIQPQNCFGFDTDPNAIALAKKRIKERTGYETPNIFRADFLEAWGGLSADNQRFDFVFTNPPWGKKIKKSQREIIAAEIGAGRSFDTTSLFLCASLKLLSANGTLGFLVQEAFFNISSFADSRNRILEKDLLRVKDYGKPFPGLITKAQAFILKNKYAPKSTEKVECCFDGGVHFRLKESFCSNPRKIVNFWLTPESTAVMEHVFAIPHKTLANNTEWALGIVTGNNSKHVHSQSREGLVPVFKGSDITVRC